MLTPSGGRKFRLLAAGLVLGFAAFGQTQIDSKTQMRNGPSLNGDNVWGGNNNFAGALSVILGLPWVSSAQPNLYTAGATQTFQGSQLEAPFGVAAQATVPTNIKGGQFFLLLMGLL